MNATQILIVAAVVAYLIVRRFLGAPVQIKSLAVPVVLTAYGLITVDQGLHGKFTSGDVAMLAIEAIVGLAAGFGRGRTIKLYMRDGHLWQRYGLVTLGVWLALIAARIGFAAGGSVIGVTLPIGGTLMATFGLSMLVESLVVQRRAAATGAAIMRRRSRSQRMAGIR